MLIILIPSIILTAALIYHILTYRYRQKYAHIPSPHITLSPKWIVGHGPYILQKAKEHGFNLTAIVESFRADLKNTDTIVLFSPGTKPCLLYSVRSEVHSRVYSDHRAFLKQKPALDYVNGVRVLGPNGLVLEKGSEVWYQKRMMMDPAFKKDFLKIMVGRLQVCSNKMIDYLNSCPDKDNVDIYPIMRRTTMEIICSCGFNLFEDFINAENSPIDQAISDIFQIGALKIFNSFTFWMPFKFSKEKELLYSQVKYVRSRLKEHLQNRYDAVANGTDTNDDILSHIIRGNMWQDKLTMEDLVDDFLVFMIGGMETTSITMSILMWLLLKNPEVAKKAIAEVNEVYGDKGDLEFEDLTKLTYLEQCIKETLRLHPPLQIAFRISPNRPETVDNILIPSNTKILISIEGIHRSMVNWSEPMTFNPERFKRGSHIKPFKFLPFGAGPRVCIGKHFAMVEAKVIISKLLHNVRFFDPCPEKRDLEKVTALSSKPKDGVFVGIVC